jgi:homoserine dehydrogenase
MQAADALHILPIEQIHSAYYLRLRALDKPGVMADITKILAERQISIDAMMQKEPLDNEDAADIVILTHITQEKNINQAIVAIEQLSALDGQVVKLRMEALSR